MLVFRGFARWTPFDQFHKENVVFLQTVATENQVTPRSCDYQYSRRQGRLPWSLSQQGVEQQKAKMMDSND